MPRFAFRLVFAGFLGAWFVPQPGFAEFQFKKGSFTKIGAASTQSVTGVGFPPKAVIFFWTRQTAADTFTPEIQVGYGFATGPANERAVAIASQDGVFGGNTGKGQWQSSSIVLFNAATPTAGAQAELTSLDGDGFTLNWTINEARADIIHYVALGGSDITNAKVDHFVKATGTGNLSVTGVGFKPDFVMFLGAHTTSLDVGTTEAQVAIGFASGPTERGAVGVQLEDGDGFSRGTCNWQRADRVLLELSDTCAADTEFDFVSFDSDGFTVNRILNNNDTRLVHFLALQGGEYQVGSFNKSTASPAPVDQAVTGLGFPPVGLMLASKNRVTNAADETNARLSLGAGDGTTEGATWWHDLHAITADNAERTSTSKIAVHGTEPSTLDAEADLKSFDADGFTLTWTTNDNLAAHEILYVTMGSSTHYRSIGTAADDTAGTLTATTGSRVVTGSGTGWRTANRGRGDRIQIDGQDYTVFQVLTDAQLTLTGPFQGTTGSGKAYRLSRQFTTLQAWEDCISFGGACTYFPVASASLVADNRSEVGIAYDESAFTSGLLIDGSTTDAVHTITLTADDGNRHYGVAGNGVVLDNGPSLIPAIRMFDDFVTVEWLEIKGGSGPASDGIIIDNITPTTNALLVRNCLIHDVPLAEIRINDVDSRVDIYNNILYNASRGIRFAASPALARVLNNTVYNCSDGGISSASAAPNVTLRNNIAHSNGPGDYSVGALNAASSNNLASDTSGTTHSPAGGGINSVSLVSMKFVSTTLGSENLHITAGSAAENVAADLSSVFAFDVDGGGRLVPWDIGADDILATTAVRLASFEARGLDRAIELTWETASELNNLGFHLYRAGTAEGPYERITANAIPGLGSSPVGARYRYTDSGLANGQTYFYQLEDIETTGRTKRHGPVSAATGTSASGTGPSSSSPETRTSSSLIYGDPSAVSLRVVERSPRRMVLELSTGGFVAEPQGDGSVRLSIPGFEEQAEPGAPSLPVKRTWVNVEAGRAVRLRSVRVEEMEVFSSLRPAAAEASVAVATRRRGTVRAGRAARREGPAFRGRASYPEQAARLVSVGYQAEQKKALLEFYPVRWKRETRELVLARRLVVVLVQEGREPDEQASHRERASHEPKRLLARLVARERGLYGVPYEALAGTRGRAVPASSVRLTRQGEPLAFHLEPDNGRFGPGSTLYFLSQGASLNPYGAEAVYELEWASGGWLMPVGTAVPRGQPTTFYWQRAEQEQNRYYQAGLLEAEDVWLWDLLFAPVTRSYPFEVSALADEPARLEVWLQGASDLGASPDHHVRLRVNGTVLAESFFEGKRPRTLSADIPGGVLREGQNQLEIENVGDTEAAYSMVMLDRFAVTYPRRLRADGGKLEGTFAPSGTAELSDLPKAHLLDVSEGLLPRWLVGAEASPSGLRFAVEAGRRYLAVAPEAVLKPEMRKVRVGRLKSDRNRADYLVVGPQSFLPAAQPLLELRQSQGLLSRAVAVEEIYSEFGHGESTPQAVRDFLSYAYHHWRRPAPQYVLLLGDGTYDFKDYLGAGTANRVPPYMVKTSYLWTASDAAYAAVNGEDILPDLAIGRLPAATAEEARVMVEKLVAYEASGSLSGGPAVLVADNPDRAGDFEVDAEEIATSVLADRTLHRIYLGRLGVEPARQAISQAFDAGASLLSYVGHGGIHLWADENLFNTSQVRALGPQSQQPLVLTLNCLNGYWHFPYFNSLGEELVKVEGRGAIAAFSPSGLSLNEPAHLFHQLLLAELVSRRHRRLGNAVLAAQTAYARSGAFPELLRIYHLLGDPALTLR